MRSKYKQINKKCNKKKLRYSIVMVMLCICGCTTQEKPESLEVIELKENTVEETPVEERLQANKEDENAPQIADEKEQYIAVYICGAICNPGVYELAEESRIHQLLDKAGGMTEDAATTYLNQAQVLVDGEKIYVPTQSEVELGTLPNTDGLKQTDPIDQKVNINTANMDELMQITGVGEAKAQSIIDYRTDKGPFRKIEDIQNIPGIKEGVFQKIKDEIDVK